MDRVPYLLNIRDFPLFQGLACFLEEGEENMGSYKRDFIASQDKIHSKGKPEMPHLKLVQIKDKRQASYEIFWPTFSQSCRMKVSTVYSKQRVQECFYNEKT